MKLLFGAAVLIGILAASTAAQSPSVTYVEGQKVADALAKGGSLVTASDLTVSGNHRTGPGQVEVHAKETDVLYMVEGDATFVTGGTMVGGRQTAPGQMRGTDVQGGQTQHLKKGDVVVIPAGIPHWFKDVSPTVSYLTVKVLKP